VEVVVAVRLVVLPLRPTSIGGEEGGEVDEGPIRRRRHHHLPVVLLIPLIVIVAVVVVVAVVAEVVAEVRAIAVITLFLHPLIKRNAIKKKQPKMHLQKM